MAKTKKITKIKFLINVVIYYYEGTTPNQYREPIQNIIRWLAWLHGLDYSIENNTKLFENNSQKKDIVDIIYLRSGQQTRVGLREFQKLFNGLFQKSTISFFTVDVFYQSQTFTKRYPFPQEFCRPLNYPYIELHNAHKKELMVYPEALDLIQNSHVN